MSKDHQDFFDVAENETITGNTTFTGTTTFSGATAHAATTITSTSANALAVGPNGTTNPSLKVDASTASAATGIKVTSAAAGSGVALEAISSGTDEALTIDSKGAGVITLAAPTTVSSTNSSAFTVGRNGQTNSMLKVDAGTSSAATGFQVKGAAAASGLALSTISSGTDENVTFDAKGSGTITLNGTATGNIVLGRATTGVSLGVTGAVTTKTGTAVPASAGAVAAGAPLTMFSSGPSIYVTSDAPAFAAVKGSLCINTAGSSALTRLYVNTDGSTTWTNVTTAA